MWGGGYGMGAGAVIWIVVILAALALIVVGIVLLVRPRPARRGDGEVSSPVYPPSPMKTAELTALQILEQRYARGDIDREEFLQRKADLSS